MTAPRGVRLLRRQFFSAALAVPSRSLRVHFTTDAAHWKPPGYCVARRLPFSAAKIRHFLQELQREIRQRDSY
jgi:hypothetical protein